ncbi:hypothetical protein TNCV_3433741 [Trichonephila clavipes]|nr:hypothetical protein TNCV_3433741 [Trichonephila clavipes]
MNFVLLRHNVDEEWITAKKMNKTHTYGKKADVCTEVTTSSRPVVRNGIFLNFIAPSIHTLPQENNLVLKFPFLNKHLCQRSGVIQMFRSCHQASYKNNPLVQ